MKRILHLDKGKYLTVDTYGDQSTCTKKNMLLFGLCIVISALTASALVGVDITKINSVPTQHIHGY
jgi:hypothetical protein